MHSRELDESTAMSVTRLATCSINCSWTTVTDSNEETTTEDTESITSDPMGIVTAQAVQ